MHQNGNEIFYFIKETKNFDEVMIRIIKAKLNHINATFTVPGLGTCCKNYNPVTLVENTSDSKS